MLLIVQCVEEAALNITWKAPESRARRHEDGRCEFADAFLFTRTCPVDLQRSQPLPGDAVQPGAGCDWLWARQACVAIETAELELFQSKIHGWWTQFHRLRGAVAAAVRKLCSRGPVLPTVAWSCFNFCQCPGGGAVLPVHGGAVLPVLNFIACLGGLSPSMHGTWLSNLERPFLFWLVGPILPIENFIVALVGPSPLASGRLGH